MTPDCNEWWVGDKLIPNGRRSVSRDWLRRLRKIRSKFVRIDHGYAKFSKMQKPPHTFRRRGDLDVDGWIISGRISRRWDVGIWSGLGWPRIETVGGRLFLR